MSSARTRLVNQSVSLPRHVFCIGLVVLLARRGLYTKSERSRTACVLDDCKISLISDVEVLGHDKEIHRP